VRVEEAVQADAALVDAIAALVPQLSSSSAPPDLEQLSAIVASPATRLLLAYDTDGRVVGTLTLAVFTIPTGTRAIIEDVVVDGGARGQGVGAALVEAALAAAEADGARTVDLTSRPEREDANRLYLRMGFERRTTNVYRYAHP
jgi:ribosomal protein S18 acetylase RimI-like enzyme